MSVGRLVPAVPKPLQTLVLSSVRRCGFDCSSLSILGLVFFSRFNIFATYLSVKEVQDYLLILLTIYSLVIHADFIALYLLSLPDHC